MIGVLAATVGVAVLLAPLGTGHRRTPQRASRSAPTPPNRRRFTRPTVPVRRLGSIGAVLAALVIVGPLLTIGFAIAVSCWPQLRALRRERTRRRAIDAALPDAIELLVFVVHAGLTPHQAIELLTERAPPAVRPAFAETRRRVERGAPLADALGALPELLGPSATVVADTLAMAERHGTPIADALAQLALDVRERRRRRAEADARTLPIRMSVPLVACTLPSFVLIAIVPAAMAALSSLSDTGW